MNNLLTFRVMCLADEINRNVGIQLRRFLVEVLMIESCDVLITDRII